MHAVQVGKDCSEVSESYDTSSFEDDNDAPPQIEARQQPQSAKGSSTGRKTKSPVGQGQGR